MYGRPNIIKALKTLICFVLAFALTVICGATVASADDSQSQINTTLSGYSKIDEVDGYALFADMDTGNFCLADKTGHSWYSSPQDISEDPYSKSSTKTVLRSLLSITYVNKQEVVGTAKEYTVNSYAAVKAGTVEVSSHDGVVRVVYTFEEQKFVVPVEYKLEKNHISVSIDIGGIKEG